MHDVLFFNTKLMADAGLDPTKLPQTMDEFYETAKAISALGTDANGNKIWGYVTATDRSELSANIFNAWLFNFGGDVLDADGKVIINNEAGVAALTFMKKLVDEGIMPAGFPFRDQYNLMANYQAGGFSDGSYARDVLRITSGKGEEWDKDMAVALHPVAVGDPANPADHKSIFHHHTLVLFNQCEYPEEAFNFIKFLQHRSRHHPVLCPGIQPLPALRTSPGRPLLQPGCLCPDLKEGLAGAKLYGISNTSQYAQAVDFIAIAGEQSALRR